MIRKIAALGILMTLTMAIFAQPAHGFIARNTFQHEATVSPNGRVVLVTARIACSAGERLSVEVTMTQDSALAYGRGRTETACASVDLYDPDAFQEVRVRVIARGPNAFVRGPADAIGLAITKATGKPTDVRIWQPEAGLTIE
jgi:hypothetical protein